MYSDNLRHKEMLISDHVTSTSDLVTAEAFYVAINSVPAKRGDLFGWESNCGPGGK